MKDEALREYANLLQENGFTIYEPVGTTGSSGEYFAYSREVDDQECFGYVQSDRYNGGGRPFGGYSHTMPIKPSKEHGSSMFVDALAEDAPQLTVWAARAVAQPTNYNHIVGTQKNYRDERWIDQGYTKRSQS